MSSPADDPPPDERVRRMFDIRSSELDALGNRVLEVELTAVRTHPTDVRRALGTDQAFSLRWTCTHDDGSTVAGSCDADDPVFRMVFQVGVHPDGVWTTVVEAVGLDGTWRRELWRQLVLIQKRLRLAQERILELAHRYAPIFLYSNAERYFPVSLRTLLRSEEVLGCTDAMTLRTIFGKERIPLADLGDFLRFNGHSEYLLDFDFLGMRRSVFARIGGDPRASTIYTSYFEDPHSDRFFINYHQIYAYDTKAGIARLTGIGPHVFDRESMVLVFDEGDRPSSMIVSGHLENQTIFFLGRVKVWNHGRVRVAFDDPRTLKLGTHPIIAVAEGSHALYPTSGVYQLSLLNELAGHLYPEDEAASGIHPERALLPPTLRSPTFPCYDLRSLGVDRITSRIHEDADGWDGHNAYLAFSGYWVDVPGTTNARFDPFTRKVSHIEEWVDGAYEWHWDDVPERYHDSNHTLLRFLHENLEDF